MNNTLEDEIREYAVALDAVVDRRISERADIAMSGRTATTPPRGRLRLGLVTAGTLAATLTVGTLVVVRSSGETSSQQIGTTPSAASVPDAGTNVTSADTMTSAVTANTDPSQDPLASVLNLGDTGVDVARLQERLAELFFVPGPADGVYSKQTEQAVWAYKSLILQIPPDQLTAEVTNEMWQTMQQPLVILPRRNLGTHTTHIEIYLPQQVLAVFTDDRPTLIAHISSGTERQYCETVTFDTDQKGVPLDTPIQKAVCSRAITPPGLFKISRNLEGKRITPLGTMTNPIYFNYGIAIAGDDNVPALPASRGGVRVNQTVAAQLPGLVHIGDTVYVWGNDGREPEDHTKAESLPSFQYPDPTVETQPPDIAASVHVPLLTGLLLADARAVLSEKGLLAEVAYEDVPYGSPNTGRVVSQTPAVAQPVSPGTSISVMVGRALPAPANPVATTGS